MSIQEYLEIVVKKDASDLHLIVGSPAMLRVDGGLVPVSPGPLTPEDTESLVFELLSPEQKELVRKALELANINLENHGTDKQSS